MVLSGFFDLQVNGFAGVDFNTPGLGVDEIDRAVSAMRATGVTRCLPTLITSSLERFTACAWPIAASLSPAIAGLHLEGPYVSPLDGPRGAHPAAWVRDASIDDYHRREDAAGGRVRLVTLAPEVPGAIALIEHLVERGVRVAIGHTAATPAQIHDAVRAGATLSTHLGNGCADVQHRHHNVIWPQLAADALSASVIADGHHLPDDMLKSVLRAKGLARAVLVTDAMAAAGAPPGRYRLGDLEVEREASGRVGLPGTPYLAGSSLTMDAAIGHVVRVTGCTLDRILPLATTQPAALVGLEPAGTVSADWDATRGTLTVIRVDD
ncbi:MAG: amidohydrolase family protein [Acidobacteria bacterium]|nr:amidohydrolase family protein [Acidobacteriota bacterium]